MIESIDSGDVLRTLREGCCRGLGLEHQRILLARTLAGSARTAAPLLFMAERTLRDRLAQAEDIILVPLGLPRDTALAAVWMGFHRECCAAEGWALAEKSAIFPARMT